MVWHNFRLIFSKMMIMKRAILYTRVSTDEQAQKGFSLPHQKMMLEKYCSVKEITVVKHYEEDFSAKNFDRPEFNKLMLFIKANRGKIDLLVFTRWDRFSRNQEEALRVIRELKKYGVTLDCVEQSLDMNQPESKVMLALYLSIPEVENDKISIRTTEGIRRAKIEGCWTGVAPIGYKNHRNEADKSTLIPSEDSLLVQEAFQLYSRSIYSLEEVRRKMLKKGLKISKQQFYNMMQAVVYIGKVVVFAYGQEEERIVEGLHEPIVTEELFYKVQSLIKSNRKQPLNKTTKREELPLRGYLKCPVCGKNLTGSGSRSRSGDLHYYYHCQKGCKVRFRADRANNDFIEYLTSLSVSEGVLALYQEILRDLSNSNYSKQEEEIAKLEKERENILSLKTVAEDKYFSCDISKDIFDNAVSRYDTKIMHINGNISELKTSLEGFNTYLEQGLPLISNIHTYYSKVPVQLKQKIVGSIFPGKLIYEDKKYRTTEMNKVFSLLLNGGADSTNRTIKKGQSIDQPFLPGSSGRT